MRSTDFKDQSNQDIEYTYNKNGAMTQDLNKGIESITYNSLNLPRKLTIQKENGKATNLYTYTASGQKLRVIHRYADMRQILPMSGTTLTNSAENVTNQKDYVGNKIYEDGKLKQIQLGNGYIEDGNYYFYIKDHLGNNRIVADATGKVEQPNEYYPFGGMFAESTDQDKQDFKYNGKEYDSMHGLNQYDYEARFYDPGFIRFTTMDPHSENYYNWSPHAYVANNPMKFIDPTGKEIIFMTRIKNKVVFLEYNLQGNVKNLSTGQIYDGNKLGGHLGRIVDGYNYMLRSGDANYKNQVTTLIKSKNIHHVDATNKSRNHVLPGSRNESIKESKQKAKEGIPIGTTTNYNFSEDKLSNGLPKTNRISICSTTMAMKNAIPAHPILMLVKY